MHIIVNCIWELYPICRQDCFAFKRQYFASYRGGLCHCFSLTRYLLTLQYSTVHIGRHMFALVPPSRLAFSSYVSPLNFPRNGKQKTENRKQKTENRKQKTEGGGQKTENRKQKIESKLKTKTAINIPKNLLSHHYKWSLFFPLAPQIVLIPSNPTPNQ